MSNNADSLGDRMKELRGHHSFPCSSPYARYNSLKTSVFVALKMRVLTTILSTMIRVVAILRSRQRTSGFVGKISSVS
jgi:hypothetical protein